MNTVPVNMKNIKVSECKYQQHEHIKKSVAHCKHRKTCMHACTHTHTHTQTYCHTHTHRHKVIHTITQSHTHHTVTPHTHTHTRAHVHTHTCTPTHTTTTTTHTPKKTQKKQHWETTPSLTLFLQTWQTHTAHPGWSCPATQAHDFTLHWANTNSCFFSSTDCATKLRAVTLVPHKYSLTVWVSESLSLVYSCL